MTSNDDYSFFDLFLRTEMGEKADFYFILRLLKVTHHPPFTGIKLFIIIVYYFKNSKQGNNKKKIYLHYILNKYY